MGSNVSVNRRAVKAVSLQSNLKLPRPLPSLSLENVSTE